MPETSWERLHRIANARRERMGLTQEGLHELGGPSKAWLASIRNFEGEPRPRHAAGLRRLDAALRWPEGTAWDLVSTDRSDWPDEILQDEERELLDPKDKIAVFMLLAERKLRTLPPHEVRPAMLDIGRRLGLPVLPE